MLSGIWNDHHNDSLKSPLRYSDEDGNFFKMETFKEKMMRLRGSYFDPFADYSNLYYGVTHYGWTPPQEISLEQQQILLDLNIAIVQYVLTDSEDKIYYFILTSRKTLAFRPVI